MTLTFVVSLLIYVQKPDDSVAVEELGFTNLLDDTNQQEQSASADQVWEVCEDTEDAGASLREALRERKTKITLMLSEENEEDESDYNEVFDRIYNVALEHTGVGDEGDYLKWHLSKISVTYAQSSDTFEISTTYLDDASMEEETSRAVKEVEDSLSISSEDSTYDKIYSIYDYLAKHITYDEEDESNLPHTAYDAAVNGKAVCQGYATLFYRILLDYGIDNRMVVSETHAWNLVLLDGEYYECDLTWDSQEVQAGNEYAYLLKADLSEGNTAHNWKTDALDSEVLALDRSSSDYDEENAGDGGSVDYKKIALQKHRKSSSRCCII
jgi:transglutaminase/protease-like cytokinesis protein 3